MGKYKYFAIKNKGNGFPVTPFCFMLYQRMRPTTLVEYRVVPLQPIRRPPQRTRTVAHPTYKLPFLAIVFPDFSRLHKSDTDREEG